MADDPFERPIPIMADLEMIRDIVARLQAQLSDLAGHLGRVERSLAGGLPARLRSTTRSAKVHGQS